MILDKRRGRRAISEPLRSFTVANPSRDARTVEKIRQLPEVVATDLLTSHEVPGRISNAELAHFLGAINTNSHSLDMGGSAVFLIGAMMQSGSQS